MTDEPDIQPGERELRQRVERLTRELIQIIDTGTTTQREDLRELAIELLRSDTFVTDDVADSLREALPESGRPATGANAFGVAILLLLMGGVLVILFPVVGLLMFLGAAVAFAWGMVATVFVRS